MAIVALLSACSQTGSGSEMALDDAPALTDDGANQADGTASGGITCKGLIACACVLPQSSACLTLSKLENNATSNAGAASADQMCDQIALQQPDVYSVCFVEGGLVDAAVGGDAGLTNALADATGSTDDAEATTDAQDASVLDVAESDVAQGDVRYWPGRGEGSWGTGAPGKRHVFGRLGQQGTSCAPASIFSKSCGSLVTMIAPSVRARRTTLASTTSFVPALPHSTPVAWASSRSNG